MLSAQAAYMVILDTRNAHTKRAVQVFVSAQPHCGGLQRKLVSRRTTFCSPSCTRQRDVTFLRAMQIVLGDQYFGADCVDNICEAAWPECQHALRPQFVHRVLSYQPIFDAYKEQCSGPDFDLEDFAYHAVQVRGWHAACTDDTGVMHSVHAWTR